VVYIAGFLVAINSMKRGKDDKLDIEQTLPPPPIIVENGGVFRS